MAKKFKDYYDTGCAKMLAEKIKAVWTDFDDEHFVLDLAQSLENKEFLERQDVFVNAFEKYISDDYGKVVGIFHQFLGPELKTADGMFREGWWLWPVGRYVEKHGIKDQSLSLGFIYELTKRFTGEFAIRPLIEKDPAETLETMLTWSLDENVHVRRLSSEGLRIRLPWAKKSHAAVQEFDRFKKILGNLKNDKEKFVQKSVGNNLNDLMKEDPEKAKEIIFEWEKDGPTKETLWIIRHGLRSER